MTIWYIPATRTMLETYGFEFNPGTLEKQQCGIEYGGGGQGKKEDERLMFGETCCLRTFKNETCLWYQSEQAIPLQIASIPLLFLISLGLPYFFYTLIKSGIDELNKGGYILKRDAIQRSVDSKKLDIKNMKKLGKLIRRRKKVPPELMEYSDMGRNDIIRDKETKDEIKELLVKQKICIPKRSRPILKPKLTCTNRIVTK